ncbi:hypothetical protein K461DRAFT_276057 [Myriangium duriaei CBS 260.36]|uniref:DUF1640 domain-containing protein n=1 Tax=Myriangium duriaei CBS 260.36 TaxID=1168546 RepID=A0A9P4J6C1_9PEZI|nr:hypothetical protein K461DRAFT_276057 [Myriangium duriaei CBS 260.36]
MAAPRLPFLWPFLFKSARTRPPRTLITAPQRGLRSSTRQRQEISTQRYGAANEPPPQLRKLPSAQQEPSNASKSDSKASAKSNGKSKKDKDKEKDKTPKEAKGEAASKDTPQDAPPLLMSPEPDAAAAPSILSMPPPSSTSDKKPEQKQASPEEKQDPSKPSLGPDNSMPKTAPPPPPKVLSTNPLEAVLNMPTSTTREAAQVPAIASYYHENASANPDEQRPPHISTPRYVHHFDTYSLVKRLGEGQWAEHPAVTVMKAVRLILADNMELAREGLVSKSDVENETYLFRAACSELRTEVGMRRKAETEKTRTERSGLQHEVDILGQRVGMEAAGLREELKGMVEGRKMAVREEGRSVDSKIQELNYRITVALNSDLRSDVEGVRWIITKRAITALAVCVLMVIASLKYASSVWQHEEEMKKRAAAAAAAANASNGNGSNGGGNGEKRNAPQPQQGGGDADFFGGARGPGELVVRQGDNPGYVSLG